MRTRRAFLHLLPAAALTSASLLTAPFARAQNSYFGQNQVQYQKFEWRVKKTDHFDVHYYKGMEEAAIIAAIAATMPVSSSWNAAHRRVLLFRAHMCSRNC